MFEIGNWKLEIGERSRCAPTILLSPHAKTPAVVPLARNYGAAGPGRKEKKIEFLDPISFSLNLKPYTVYSISSIRRHYY